MRADHDKNLNQRQIDEAILKFLMTYRCTPHSGTEMSPSYLMLKVDSHYHALSVHARTYRFSQNIIIWILRLLFTL